MNNQPAQPALSPTSPRRRGAPIDGPRTSRGWMRFFARYTRRYMARHFDALLLSKAGSAPSPAQGPVVIYLNHPSWWDPITCIQLSTHCFPASPAFGPMDATELARYGIFKKIGVFGVRKGPAGVRDFLDASATVLAQADATLWITAQGRFADSAERPVVLAPGIGALVRIAPHASFVPLAVDYPFWNERLPQALARFGAAEKGSALLESAHGSREALTAHFERRLTETMDALACESRARDLSAFTPVLSGQRGTSPIYDTWRRLKSWMRGESYQPGHSRS